MSKTIDKAIKAVDAGSSADAANLFNKSSKAIQEAMSLCDQAREKAIDDKVPKIVEACNKRLRKLQEALR